MSAALITIDDLHLGSRGHDRQPRPILRGVSLSVKAGETIGIVGESGSGKSTVALAMMGYLKPGLEVFSGRVVFNGYNMLALPEPQRAQLRGREIALIPQNAGQALTPTMTVGAQIEEALALHSGIASADRAARVIDLLALVRLPAPADIARRYPHELSGGQQQRVAIAMALGTGARTLLLDEPTTGLDVTTQAHILAFLRGLASELKIAMVYVSHDLGVIAHVADRVAVMYAGELVEEGTVRGLLQAPAHPYPQALLGSIPRLGERVIPASLPGFPPPVGEARNGCAFAPRCLHAIDRCRKEVPQAVDVAHGSARCFRVEEAAQEKPAGIPVVSSRTNAVALEIRDLSVSYFKRDLLDRITGVKAPPDTVACINFVVRRGETLGLVGESGSGKSTLLRAISGLKPPKSGTIQIGGKPMPGPVAHRNLEDTKLLQMIFQNADTALNPRLSVREILEAPLKLYFRLGPADLAKRVEALVDAVRLPKSYLDRFPSQLSGGEKQRIGIARAFAAEPDLVLCDEVTSALDVSVQAGTLALLKRLQDARGVAYIFVSHDLAVVRAISDQVAVLYQGRICEIGPTEAVFAAPFHPYTEILLGAILEPDPEIEPRLLTHDAVEKEPPSDGCPFQRRCPCRAGPICDTVYPPAHSLADGHRIHCHHTPTELAERGSSFDMPPGARLSSASTNQGKQL